MSTISAGAEGRREDARRSDGRFGRQEAQEAPGGTSALPVEGGPVSHEDAVRVDTELERIWLEQAHVKSQLRHHLDCLHHAVGDEREELPQRSGRVKQGPWKMLDDDAVNEARTRVAQIPPVTPEQVEAKATLEELGAIPWAKMTPEQDARFGAAWSLMKGVDEKSSRRLMDALDDVDGDHATLSALAREAEPFEEQYATNPWPRFFIVQQANGHIHSSMHCSTCFPTTQFGWLPKLSGLTEKDAVEQEGTILCSVCFPTAPVEWTVGKAPDDDTCPGSGQQMNWTYKHPKRGDDGARRGFAAGNGAPCPECGKWVAVTSNGYGKFRKHKSA